MRTNIKHRSRYVLEHFRDRSSLNVVWCLQKHKPPAEATNTPAISVPKPSPASPFLSSNPTNVDTTYPISQNPPTPVTESNPTVWPASQQGRPTLSGGTASGRIAGEFLSGKELSAYLMHISGTPAQLTRSTDDSAPYTFEETRTRRKNSPGDQSMRRSIQDLVASIDPNVKIEPEVEDVCTPTIRR